jgi:hypothetical protein
MGEDLSELGRPGLGFLDEGWIERAIARRTSLFRVALAVLCAAELLSFVGVVHPPHLEPLLFVREGNVLLASGLAGAYVVFLASQPGRRLAFATTLAGIALEALQLAVRGAHHEGALARYGNFGAGLGIATLLALTLALCVQSGAARRATLARLMLAATIPVFSLISRGFVDLTVFLHPRSFDAILYVGDAALVGSPSFVMGQAFHAFPLLAATGVIVYFELPLAVSLIAAAQARRGTDSDLAVAFLTSGVVGATLYHLVPALGPRYVFSFPFAPPDPSTLPLEPLLSPPGFRNCVPSLHTTWALLLYWHAREHRMGLQVFALVWLLLTLTATLGLGEHYALDLIIAVPFAAGMHASLRNRLPWRAHERWSTAAVGAALTALWILLLRVAPWIFRYSPRSVAVFATVTALLPLWLEYRLHRRAEMAVVARAPAPIPASGVRASLATARACSIFFVAGCATVVLAFVLARSLALLIGAAVLPIGVAPTAWLGGQALGAWAGSRGMARRLDPLKAFALCELGIAGWCASSAWQLAVAKSLYAAAQGASHDSAPGAVALTLGGLLLGPPAVIAGFSLPILARLFDRPAMSAGRGTALLYACHTLGGAIGAGIVGYAALPFFGVTHTTWLAAGAHLLVALLALQLVARTPAPRRAADRRPADPAYPDLAPAREECRDTTRGRDPPLRSRPWLLMFLVVGGAIALGVAVTYAHLLAAVAGTTIFARTDVLLAWLLGTGLGAALGVGWSSRRWAPAPGLVFSQALLAASVLAGVFAWSGIPGYLASYAAYPLARTFAQREFVRLLVCCCALVPPAAMAGASYAIALDCSGPAPAPAGIRRLGAAIACHTLGQLGGALLVCFAILPRLGSLRTLQLLGTAAVAASVLPFPLVAGTRPARVRLALLFAPLAVIALLFFQPGTLDLTRLASGAHRHFDDVSFGQVVDHAESIEGGITTVATAVDPGGRPVTTLLADGVPQGDDSPQGDVAAQVALATFPLLHTQDTRRALLIGLGTGVRAKVLVDAGFRDVDVTDRNSEAVRLARRHFGATNGDVLDRPDVHVSVVDGRRFLADPREGARYDLISIDVASIGSSGAAALYNREAYALARARLSEEGVLGMTLDLSRLGIDDYLSVLATLRSVFANVWLYSAAGRGILVACSGACGQGEDVDRFLEVAPLRERLALLDRQAHASFSSLLRDHQLLAPATLAELLARSGLDDSTMDYYVSTDDNPFLEFHAPRADARSAAAASRSSALRRIWGDGGSLPVPRFVTLPQSRPR